MWTDQSSIFGYQSYLTAIQMQNLRDNLAAIANGDAGAPSFTTSAYDGRIFDTNKFAPALLAKTVTSGGLHDHSVTTKIESSGIKPCKVNIHNISNSYDNTVTAYINPNGSIIPPAGWIAWAARSGELYTEYVHGAIQYPSPSSPIEMYLDGNGGLGAGGGIMFFTGSDQTHIRNTYSDTATIYYRRFFA